jgi:hypothetical protein
VLDRKKVRITEERSSKSAPMTDADVKALLASVDEVVVAKGKAVRSLAAGDAVLGDLRGPTGNFRAPMLRVGKRLLVGFHLDALETLLRG